MLHLFVLLYPSSEVKFLGELLNFCFLLFKVMYKRDVSYIESFALYEGAYLKQNVKIYLRAPYSKGIPYKG